MKWKAFGIAVLVGWAKAVAAPNIILIMADDLGYGGLSCYGNKVIRTPHLDALAASGVKCTDFHSNGAVCSPTRAALMTGRYQQRSGVEGVITAAGHREVGLGLEEKTMAEALHELGYATALFGKWHLGYEARFGPVKQGFDEFRGFVSGNVDYHTHVDQEGYFDWWQQDQKKDEKGYLTDLITEDALDFMERKKDGPFFVVLHHGAPHYPLQDRGTPGFRKVRNGEGRRTPQPQVNRPAVYAKMVEIMDEGVGRIVARLGELKLRENTLMVFCSDNGPAMTVSPSGLRGRKGQLLEGGHRVPGIFNWPGGLPEGAVCHTPIMTMDLMPTFLAMAGGKPQPEHPYDGRDVTSILEGKATAREPLFWRFKGEVAVREGDWKLIRQAGKKALLFDLSKDLGESTDLSQVELERVKRMTDLIFAWEKEVMSEKNVSR
jgi:arylsulfatase A-like enzyme